MTGPTGPTGIGATGPTGPTGPAGSVGTIAWKEPCRAATTANITISTALNNGDTLDGVTLATNDRVLVKDQTTKSENGIWVVDATPARATDADAAGELTGGSTVRVTEGTAQADTQWTITTNGSITPGTTAHDWARTTPRDYGLVTALPTSPAPVSGDRCVYTDSLSTPTFRWQLVYNASSSSSYKWECVGGSPMIHEVGPTAITSSESTTSTTYTNLTTSGPTLTLPLAGDYDITASASVYGGNADWASMSYSVGGTAAIEADAVSMVLYGGRSERTARKTALAAATVLTAKYKQQSTGTASFFGPRQLRAVPIRVG